MVRKSTRRDLLKSGAIATAGAGILGGGAAAAETAVQGAQVAGRGRYDADVIVVGAGFSGMVAAYTLLKARRSVIVIDALPRVGGRSWSTTLSNGKFFDVGAGWVSTRSEIIQDLIQEFRLQTYFTVGRDPGDGLNTLVGLNGQVDRYSEFPPLSDEALLQLGIAIETINDLSESVPTDEPWTAPQAEEFDRISAGLFLEELMDNEEAFTFVMNQLTGLFGLSPYAVSFLQALKMVHSVDGIQNYGQTPGGINEQRIVGGTQLIPLGIAQRLGRRNVVLGSPVRGVHHDGLGVTVNTERNSFRARRVILAVATAVSNYIRFTPALPPDRAQLMQRAPLGAVLKLQLIYDDAFWRHLPDGKGGTLQLNGNSFALDDSFITQTVDGGGPLGDDQPGVLVGFPDDDHAREMGRMTQTERRDKFIEEMVHRFGPQAAALSSTIRPNYSELIAEDFEYIRGDYAAQYGPRVLTASGFGPATREPVGRIHWAGVDLSTRFYGSLSGAAQAGQLAATEVLQAGL